MRFRSCREDHVQISVRSVPYLPYSYLTLLVLPRWKRCRLTKAASVSDHVVSTQADLTYYLHPLTFFPLLILFRYGSSMEMFRVWEGSNGEGPLQIELSIAAGTVAELAGKNGV